MRRRSAFIDHLESRRLLAASVTLSADGLLHVVGTDSGDPATGGADNVDVGADGSQVDVLLNGKDFQIPTSKVKSLLVETGAEADIISASLQVPTTLRGGAGEDYVVGTCPKTVVLSDYMDTVVLDTGGVYKYQWEGPGHSPKKISFDGVCSNEEGAGPEVNISANAPGFPTFLGGLGYVPNLTLSFTPGDDVLNFNANGFPIRLDMSGGNDQALLRNPSSKFSGAATLVGGNGDDTLTSDGSGSFVLNGGAGNDTLISSPDASDNMIGGPGVDTADYSARKRSLRITLDNQPNDGKTGEHDNVMADVENIIGGSSNDYLQGGPFNNSLVGNAGNDTLWGGAGDDTLNGGTDNDQMFGQAGNDVLLARDGETDWVYPGSGENAFDGDNGLAGDRVDDHTFSIDFQPLDFPNASDTYPMAISGSTIVGGYSPGRTSPQDFGFADDLSGFVTLKAPGGSLETCPTGIDGKKIVGYSEDTSFHFHAFLYDGSRYKMIDDPKAKFGTFPNGISGNIIVGSYIDAENHQRGFIYDGKTFKTLSGPPGAKEVVAQDVDGSTIVGWYIDGRGRRHGFIYDGTTYKTLNDPLAVYGPSLNGTRPLSISGKYIVGDYSDRNTDRGFLYDGVTFIAIDAPYTSKNYQFTTASGISRNTIAGFFAGDDGDLHGFTARFSGSN